MWWCESSTDNRTGALGAHGTQESLLPKRAQGLRSPERVSEGRKGPPLVCAGFRCIGLNLVVQGLEGGDVLQGSLKVQCNPRLMFEWDR